LFSVDPTNITPYQSNSKNKEEVISGGNHPIPTTDLSSISASRNSKTGIEIKNRRRNKFLGSFETAIDDLIPRKKIRIHSKNESLLPTGTELCFENSLSENLVWKGAVPIRNIQGNCLERTKLKSEICGILNQYIFPHVHVKKWDMYDLENDLLKITRIEIELIKKTMTLTLRRLFKYAYTSIILCLIIYLIIVGSPSHILQILVTGT
jgi:hypothetical protein